MDDIERLEAMFRESLGSRYEGSDVQRRLQRVRAMTDATAAQTAELKRQTAEIEQRIADLQREQRDLLDKATPQGNA